MYSYATLVAITLNNRSVMLCLDSMQTNVK